MRRHCLFFVPALLCCLLSCAQGVSNKTNVRTTIVSNAAGQAAVSVTVEGNDGNSLTGSLVQINDSSNSVTNLAYDSDACAYKGNVGVLSDGLFCVTVRSVLLDSEYVRYITHTPLTEKPQIVEFRDASGNSVLSGAALRGDEAIQVSWTGDSSGTQYLLAFRTATATYYSLTTNANMMQIPAKTLTSGRNYYLEIKAQRIGGDPLFKTADYCSIANSGTSNVSFTIM